MDLVELDRLQVLVVVDNETDGLSTPCKAPDPSAPAAERAAKYTSEISHLVSEVKSGQAECLDFRNICCAGHGLSVLLTAEAEGKTHTLLFDAGPSPRMIQHNFESLEVNPADIEAVVLSHWHIDHSGGLPTVARLISDAKAAAAAAAAPKDVTEATVSAVDPDQPAAAAECSTVCDLHPRHPYRRALQLPGQVIPFNKEPNPSEMELPGTKVELHAEGHTLLDKFFFEEGGAFELDEEITDERYLAAFIKGKGVIVFSACPHAGIINVMKDVQHKTGKPPYAVFGGFHLSPRDTVGRIEPTIADMVKLKPSLVAAGHCTGWLAKTALANNFKESFMPSFVGSRFSFPAAAATAAVPPAPSS